MSSTRVLSSIDFLRCQIRAHEAEKPLRCPYCGSRFKSKNEATRHQKTLHIRRHSWACPPRSSYYRLFHGSKNHPGEADVCGYCGDEFPRSGHGKDNLTLGGNIVPSRITERDWDERIQHLQDVHKFGKCKVTKRFYRADHFRQHLKHFHAIVHGEWTRTLENACVGEHGP